MANSVIVISSMATRQILRELVASYSKNGHAARVESVGGVDAARRVRAGETFDIVVLAADAMSALADEGFVIRGSVRVFACSPTAVAVPAGGAYPAHCDEAAVKTLISGAKRIGLSTG